MVQLKEDCLFAIDLLCSNQPVEGNSGGATAAVCCRSATGLLAVVGRVFILEMNWWRNESAVDKFCVAATKEDEAPVASVVAALWEAFDGWHGPICNVDPAGMTIGKNCTMECWWFSNQIDMKASRTSLRSNDWLYDAIWFWLLLF